MYPCSTWVRSVRTDLIKQSVVAREARLAQGLGPGLGPGLRGPNVQLKGRSQVSGMLYMCTCMHVFDMCSTRCTTIHGSFWTCLHQARNTCIRRMHNDAVRIAYMPCMALHHYIVPDLPASSLAAIGYRYTKVCADQFVTNPHPAYSIKI